MQTRFERKGFHLNSNTDNRRKAFADVVAIDAWHDSFSPEVSSVDLHADVVFGTARVGGDAESPVRFRLSAKRAEIVVIIPDSEPVSVDKKSVVRDAPELQGRLTKIVEQSAQASLKGSASVSASVSASHTTMAAALGVETSGQANRSSSEKFEISETVQFLAVTQSKTADGHYRWLIESRAGKILEGRPWVANKQPRLKLIDERRDRSKGIPPTVRVEIRCRREDLHIEDLEIKDEGLWQDEKWASRTRWLRPNLISAISFHARDLK